MVIILYTCIAMFIFVNIVSVYLIATFVPEPNEETDDNFVKVDDNGDANSFNDV